ncbi:UNVERIFIED_CONTAM: GDSL-type esterase/lipase family protein [Kocuria sp. CPCC 205316]|uniref:GDSL-type esterase/lipase family protein n=1 Tax=Kocuria TaxID=57493 RepID=UPI0036DA6E9A
MRSAPLRRTVTALASALALAGTAASPAAAAPRTIELVNLGDSYSAAFGTGGYQQVEDLPGCAQGTGRDHVDKLESHPRIEVTLDAACAGATTEDVRGLVSVPFVGDALAEADVVTLTMGGNDIRWGRFIQACSAPAEAQYGPGPCEAMLAQAPSLIAGAAASAAETVTAIDAVADARIVVLGYPWLFDDRQDTPLLSAERAAQLNDWTDELNAALAAAVEEEGAVFVDVTDRFRGHGVGSADPWILFGPGAGDHNLHPTERGYLSGYFPGLLGQVARAR